MKVQISCQCLVFRPFSNLKIGAKELKIRPQSKPVKCSIPDSPNHKHKRIFRQIVMRDHDHHRAYAGRRGVEFYVESGAAAAGQRIYRRLNVNTKIPLIAAGCFY